MASTHIGGLIAASPAAWVSSQQQVVVPFGRILRVFRHLDGQLLAAATLRGHSAAVVSVVQAGAMRIASASLDGTVRIWDVDEGECLRTFDLGQPLSNMCSIASERIVCVGSRSVVLLSLSVMDKTSNAGRHKIRTPLFSNMRVASTTARVAASSNGEVVAMIANNTLNLTTLSQKQPPCASVKFPFHLSAVAITNDASILAAADLSGKIHVIPNPSQYLQQRHGKLHLKLSDLCPSCLHWHSSAVQALAFSEDGNLLLSGGNEAVLVSWNMTSSLIGSRDFLPRLSAPILGISFSPDQLTYTLTHSDNSVRLINQASNVTTAVVRGISTPDCHAKLLNSLFRNHSTHHEETGTLSIATEPGNAGRLILSGSGGEAQIFDVYKGQHVEDIPILRRNVVFEKRSFNDKRHCAQPARVTLVRIHSTCKYMASVDFQDLKTRSSKDYGVEQFLTTLRIWERKRPDKPFTQVSVEAQPHGAEALVSDMCFHPSLPILATCSPNGTFKLWRATMSRKTGLPSWRCEAELGHKNLPCNALSFSRDGSLLAVATGSILTLWLITDLYRRESNNSYTKSVRGYRNRPDELSPASMRTSLLHTLVHPPSEEVIQSVSFTSGQMPLVVATTNAGVYVWHTLTQGIWWSSRVRNEAKLMVADENTGQFALVVQIPTVMGMDNDQGVQNLQDRMENCNESEQAGRKSEGCENDAMDVDSKAKDNRNDLKDGKSTPVKRRFKAGRSRGTPKGLKTVMQTEDDSKRSFDTAIAIFNAASPVPTVISKLPAGVSVSALAFVPTPGSIEGTASPLVCIDSSMEVCFYRSGESTETLSYLTGESEAVPQKSSTLNEGNLVSLLGASWKRQEITSSTTPESGKDVNYADDGDGYSSMEASVLSETFSKVFDGPVHIQAPLSSLSLDFVRGLLPSTMGRNETEGKVSSSVRTGMEISEKGLDLRDNGTGERPAFGHVEYDACSALCAKLVAPYLK